MSVVDTVLNVMVANPSTDFIKSHFSETSPRLGKKEAPSLPEMGFGLCRWR